MIVTDSKPPIDIPGYAVLPLNGIDDLLVFHRLNQKRYPHLLESVLSGTPQARYDILLAMPGMSLVLDSNERLFLDGVEQDSQDFLDVFDRCWEKERNGLQHWQSESGFDSPFHGGWFVFLSYEFLHQVEPTITPAGKNKHIPLAVATRFPAAIIHDHETGKVFAICEDKYSGELFQLITDDIKQSKSLVENKRITINRWHEDNPATYLRNVARAKQLIKDGDIFQVNLSREWKGEVKGNVNSSQLYSQLRQSNPAPFAGLMTIDESTHVISSSPERLVSINGDMVSTRPIAGTYPRSDIVDDDRRLSEQLLSNPKEQAEHIMLIDLERNDLGRVCESGSVTVRDFMTLESYRHVHHIVSDVAGKLVSSATPASVLRAVFPGGTITGCPKVRCMQIIAEIEATPRGAYTGTMGYVNHNGDMDFNILIRTLTLHGKEVSLRAGSGIVADSDPERELNETRAKARGLIAALQD